MPNLIGFLPGRQYMGLSVLRQGDNLASSRKALSTFAPRRTLGISDAGERSVYEKQKSRGEPWIFSEQRYKLFGFILLLLF